MTKIITSPPALKNYTGNKSQVWRQILNHVPKHDVRLEAFLGSGVVSCELSKFDSDDVYAYGSEIDEKTYDSWKNHLFDTYVDEPLEVYNCDYMRAINIVYNTHGEGDMMNKLFIYCDPPYLKSSRGQQRDIYNHDWNDDQHHEFLKFITKFSAERKDIYIMISHYPNSMYDVALFDWHVHSFMTSTRRGAKKEVIYMNYDPATVELHTTAYLGTDNTTRQAFNRKKNRWISKFQKMTKHEQIAMYEALGEQIKHQ